MSALTEVLEQMQEDFKALKARVDKIEPREIDSASKKNILDQLDIVTDSGTAEPSDGVLDILGGDSIDTAGAANDVTVNVTDDSIGLDKLAVGNICTTDRRFHLDFDGHSWSDLMEPGWEPTETGGVIFLGWEHMAKGVAKFGQAVQIAAAGTNLITNPVFQLGTAGWSKVQPADAIAQTADDYVYGDYCLEVTKSAGALTGCYTLPSMAVVANNTYTAYTWVKAPAGFILTLRLMGRNAGDAGVAQTDQNFTGTGDWQFVSVSHAMGALEVLARVYVFDPTGAGACVFYVDAANLIQSSYPTPPIDGSLGAGHAWTGAAHASTSTRAAATLTYPNDVCCHPGGQTFDELTFAGWFIPAFASTAVLANNPNFINSQDFALYWASGDDAWHLWMAGANRLNGSAQVWNPWEPQHFALTLKSGDCRLYVNGVLDDTDASPFPDNFGAQVLMLGDNAAGTGSINGLIDDFVIYPRVLSAAEIQTIYKFGNPLLPPTHANMRIVPGEWTSTLFNGGGFTTVGWTTLDLVDDCGIPFGAKAVSIFTLIRDSGAAGQTFQLRKDATQSPSLHAWTNAGANMWINTNGLIPVANGRTVDYQITASGALTQDIYMRIYCVYL